MQRPRRRAGDHRRHRRAEARRGSRRCIEEPILCSFGLSEPDAGSDVARIKTTAVRKGDEYVLNGSKTFITNAGYAAWTVVFAKTDPSAGHRGMSAFIVPMDTPGVTIEKHLDKMGQRSTDTSAFALSDVVVPAANRLGEEGDGFKIAMQTLDGTRPGHGDRRRRRRAAPRSSTPASTRSSASRSSSRSRCTRASTS